MERDPDRRPVLSCVMDVPVVVLQVGKGEHAPLHIRDAIEHREVLIRAKRLRLAPGRCRNERPENLQPCKLLAGIGDPAIVAVPGKQPFAV